MLDASPLSGEPGWSSEGTRRGGRNDQRGLFGNGVTYATRGPVNWETRALCGFSLLEGHWESGPLDQYLMLSASCPGVVIRLTAPGWQRSSRFSLINSLDHQTRSKHKNHKNHRNHRANPPGRVLLFHKNHNIHKNHQTTKQPQAKPKQWRGLEVTTAKPKQSAGLKIPTMNPKHCRGLEASTAKGGQFSQRKPTD